jgi:excisionase family DNA binding protein
MTVTTIPLFGEDDDTARARTGRRASARDQPTSPEPERLLTVAEAADALGIGRSKLYDLMARGAIQAVKVDRCRRIRRSEVDRFIRALPPAYG